MDSLIIYYSSDKYLPLVSQIISSSLNAGLSEIREILKTPRIIKKIKSYLNLRSNILPISHPLHNQKNIIIVTQLFKNSTIPSAVISFFKQYDLSKRNLYFVACYKDKDNYSKDTLISKLSDLCIDCQNIIDLNLNEKTLQALKTFDIKFMMNDNNALYLYDTNKVNTM